MTGRSQRWDMFNVIKRATRSGVLGAGLLALLAAPTTASGAEVSVGRESLDGVGSRCS